MLENEPFMGAFVKLPVTFLERLAIAAENHHARQARYCDASTLDGALSAISTWIEDLEKDRTQPSPTPERGDLLVKAARGEQWVLTVEGWRELAPIELVEQNVAGHPDFLVGPTADARAGWDERDTQPAKPRRFFGRSVVEDELERIHRERASGQEEPFEPLKGAELLRSHAEVLFAAVDVIRDRSRRDGGPEGDALGEDPWTLEGLEGLAYGYEHAARIIGS